ncbi:hypothetical protein WKR88_01665 [Trinickia caryophylli]|uniref:Uncharacterized protein n=1 Tax=Trinickia caryophylli TaxID=28094 RepID=A0A1X7CJ52_TRICW|nr:hypothetical protein [Trinickia caryophylli]PMS11499.1 hypothetical protein C0Z17_13530 [Trinickia caryophylli]TRX19951.1 hypothetical protein FNF07_18255 [Trinickia caryophylli]WQE12711.1 hypothetical protein U0034_04700 [Trinickia caryophylli]SME97556.1 hypothetical protein SAMN06295900_101466 [Trinickia caryophylli]GLU30419.1 hypothetical protein Busp01_02610 [Trinickia caryophylli]
MLTPVFLLYKGYELHPLVFRRTFNRFDGHSRYAEGYDIAVRICRPASLEGSPASRVFRLNQSDAFSDLGVARRAARQQGKDIIDGKVTGASVIDM